MKGKTEPASKSRSAKRSRAKPVVHRFFSDDDKLKAVSAAYTANREHPLSHRAMDAARLSIGNPTLHPETMRDWIEQHGKDALALIPARPLNEVILEQRDKTLTQMSQAQSLAMEQLVDQDKAKAASYRDSAVVFGILHDKIQDSIGLSAEIVTKVQALERICIPLGVEPAMMLQGMIDKLQARVQANLMGDDKPSISIEAHNDAE